MAVVECMRLVCEHRDQLDSRPDLKAAIGDFVAWFLYVLFHLKDYEGCIYWFEKGMGRDDALRASLMASGSVQFDVAVSFLKRAHDRPMAEMEHMVGRGAQHIERTMLVNAFDGLSTTLRLRVNQDPATGEFYVGAGEILLVPGEMFEKLLGTPHSLFTSQQAIELLGEVLGTVIDMKDGDLPVEAKALLRMGLTFAWKIEDEGRRDRYLESFQSELCEIFDSSHQNVKAEKIDQGELSEALQSKFAGSTDNNFKSNVGTEVASTSGNVDLQQPCEVQVLNLDELLARGTECLNQFTFEGTAEDREQRKMAVVECMRLVCEHRDQLDSRPDLKAAIGDFVAWFLYVLFHLKDYEGCIYWFEKGMGRDDALRASLMASGSVQFDVAVSFLKRAHDRPKAEMEHMVGRGAQHLERSFELLVGGFDGLSAKLLNKVIIDAATGAIDVRLGHLQLVPGEMFEKLLGTPHSLFASQELEQLLVEVLKLSTELKDKEFLVEAEVALEMGLMFGSRIFDSEVRNRFLEGVVEELYKVYMLDIHFRMNICTCPAFDMSDAHGLSDRKLKARLKFTYGRILKRAGLIPEAVMQMEEALSLCVKCDGAGVRDVDSVWYKGDDNGVNTGLCELLHLYGESTEYLESALSLIDLIDPIMAMEECKKYFRMSWFKEKGFIYQRIGSEEKAKKCLVESEPPNGKFFEDDVGYDSGDCDAAMESYTSNPDKLYEKYSQVLCSQCNKTDLRDPRSHWRMLFDLAECHLNDFNLALEAADAGELVVIRRLGGDRSCLVDVYILKVRIYFVHQKYDEEEEALMRLVGYLEEMDQNDYKVKGDLLHCYVRQAWLKFGRDRDSSQVAEGGDFLKKALPVLTEENRGVYYFLEAMALIWEGKIENAAAFGEMAFQELIKRQQFKPSRGTQMAEDTWIKIFENSYLTAVIRFNELISLNFMKKPVDAFIWAERSRTRFYMRRADDQPSVVYSTCELFDKHYKHAKDLLGSAVLMCGPETAIISYSYCNLNNLLFCYLIFNTGEIHGIRVHCKSLHVPTELRELGMPESQQTLERVVVDVVTEIKRMKRPKNVKNSTEKAKVLLNVLYSILIKPIFPNSESGPCCRQPGCRGVAEQLRERCKNLVISPQGFLSKVPFAALFEKQGEGRGEFLIQQKTVCVVPSIRTLHRCFERQAEFEKRWEDLAPPFVAGNPKPMGLDKGDLPEAAAEALKVANILEGAQLFSGEKMTKAAVLQGLSRSQLVLLSTHGTDISTIYPQGGLVLRRHFQFPTSNNVRTPMEKTLIRMEETLTPADIAAIPAEIPAGLVVLSACESGLGEITRSEGVLGLGRVILQKGAASVVLTLWKVDDSATTDLVTGMFENLRKGVTVPESLQTSMVHMIEKGRSIYEWAPLVAMGSPKLRLPKYSSEAAKFESFCTVTPDPSEVSELS
ncbi:hypothetical protein M758_11G022500 [Ceratodon purpureus]|nr:hypothetical protein M758_11G022500 [Ceratodon purpureus]